MSRLEISVDIELVLKNHSEMPEHLGCLEDKLEEAIANALIQLPWVRTIGQVFATVDKVEEEVKNAS